MQELADIVDIDPRNAVSSMQSLADQFSLSDKAERPEDLKDYRELYKKISSPKIAKMFRRDDMFALMRVAGQNPDVIQGIANVDASFPVTDAMLQRVAGFEGDTLHQAGADGRLFIADYSVLQDLQNADSGNGQKYGYAPKALFCVPSERPDDPMDSLVPIAIQITSEPSANTLFLPDGSPAWMMAKTLVQVADFNHHELVTHLTLTHLQMERFCVATHRRLAENHPLYRLLVPHFQGTLFINFGAELALVNNDGPFSKMFYGTMESNRQLVATVLNWRFNDAIFTEKLASRKVDNIPYYPYRDDAERVWGATQKWVSEYLSLYYGDNLEARHSAIAADTELASWALELQSENGGRLKGFGETDGKIESFDYLVKAVTSIIFTATAQHAAVNFPQSQFSGYPPNMPASLYRAITDNSEADFQDWLDTLPPLNMAELQIQVTYLLSSVVHGELGQYERGSFPDPRVKPLLNEYKMALDEVDAQIKHRVRQDRRQGARLDYDYLRLANIPPQHQHIAIRSTVLLGQRAHNNRAPEPSAMDLPKVFSVPRYLS